MIHIHPQDRRGVTLVEVLTVIGIIGVLLGLLFPAVQQVRGTAARAACSNNLHQIGLACHAFHDDQQGLPRGHVLTNGNAGQYIATWEVRLLPYVEQTGLWQQTIAAYNAAPMGYANPPHVGLATVVKVYCCPADGRLSSPIRDDKGYSAAYDSYLGVNGGTTGGDGCMVLARTIRFADITDGTSQTLLIGERPPPGRLLAGSWYTHDLAETSWLLDEYLFGGRRGTMQVYFPSDIGQCRGPFLYGPGRIENPCDCSHFWSLHAGGANFVFADGGVRFIRYGASDVLPALATRAGGESAALPD